MIIESIIREPDYCGMIALAHEHEHVYNAWMRGNNLHFYILFNDKVTDVIHHFTARIKNGKIKLVVDGVAFTLYSHDELINIIRGAFPDEWHDIITIIETLLYIE